jgi:dTDP-glucose 4,6-dehydratase
MRILVTGGAGFIGSAVCRHLVTSGAERVVNVDKLTYAGNLRSLRVIADRPNYVFRQADICDGRAMLEIMRAECIETVMHLAA